MIGTAYFKDGHTEEILTYDNGYDGIRTYFKTKSGCYKRHLTSNPELNGEYIYSKLTPISNRMALVLRLPMKPHWFQMWIVTHDIERIEIKESNNDQT